MKNFRSWSAGRPHKPTEDALYLEVRKRLKYDNRSTWAKADVSGLSTSTIRNWENGKVRYPQAASLQMAAHMLGYEIVLKKKVR